MLIRRKPKAKKRRKVRKKKSKGSFADELEPIEDGTSAYPAMAPTRRSLSRTVPASVCGITRHGGRCTDGAGLGTRESGARLRAREQQARDEQARQKQARYDTARRDTALPTPRRDSSQSPSTCSRARNVKCARSICGC